MLPAGKMNTFLMAIAAIFFLSKSVFHGKHVIIIVCVFCGIFRQTRLPVYLSHTPAGTSVRNMVHFGQVSQCWLSERLKLQ